MERKTFIVASIALLAIFLTLVYAETESAQKSIERSITFPSGTTLQPEEVNTPETRSRGLMFRDHLPEGGAMLFVFQVARPYSFWMKNCKFPIDIIWLNEAKEIVYIAANTPPCKKDPCPLYGPKKEAALYVLEVAAGFAKKEALVPGARLRFSF